MKILCKYAKKIKVHFLILWAFLENTCFMYISMGNWPVKGYNLYCDARKGLLLKNAHYFFSDFCRKCQATIPENN